MKSEFANILKGRMDAESFVKLSALENESLHGFIADAVALCKPAKVLVCSDDPADVAYCRRMAIEKGEEAALAAPGHTVHFDGMKDQGRDKEVTRYLVRADEPLSKNLNQMERDKGLAEVRGFLAGSMAGREMIVRFFCLGPTNSPFAISCVQITDSFYVAHSEDLLYRGGYEQFERLGPSGAFFRFLHSAGALT